MKLRRLLVAPTILGLVAAGAVATATTSDAATSNYTLITAPEQGYTPIYDFVNSATRSVDMTMYELNDTTFEQDLANDAARGVTVRVILDTNLEKTNNSPAFNFLNAHGVHAVWANTSFAATHQKTITVDGTDSAVMTGNLTSQFYATTRDFAVIDSNQIDVNAIEKAFNADFAHTAFTPTDGDNLVWSPTDSESQLLALINGATTTLQVENEEMGLAAVTTALENAAKRGVNVQVTMTNTANEYASEFTALTNAGAHVATYTGETPIFVHAKVIVADFGTTAARVFLGSENFSNASLNENRELGLILKDAAVLTSTHTTLTSDFNGGTPWS
ncbi:MAG TPA: phospholipase D-like domain-containing protein [Pseudonocardiaceae bacterium]|jgi:phosphatidylserine/phosphatidylglycerophosphate/cardiolipin synthase-like enzyme|nr:phospholipase D-like domain-containing protein [Pseudonocardiaceae bacterium]